MLALFICISVILASWLVGCLCIIRKQDRTISRKNAKLRVIANYQTMFSESETIRQIQTIAKLKD